MGRAWQPSCAQSAGANKLDWASAEHLHKQIEAMHLGFLTPLKPLASLRTESRRAQGMAALLALNQLDQEDLSSAHWGSAQHLHKQIEAMRLGFSDTLQFCADPDHSPIPLDSLLSKQYAQRRRGDVKADRVRP